MGDDSTNSAVQTILADIRENGVDVYLPAEEINSVDLADEALNDALESYDRCRKGALNLERENNELKEQIELAEAAKTSFLSTISNELRTPMNSIIGVSELLQSESLSPKQEGYVNVINSSAHSMKNKLGTVLDFTGVPGGEPSAEHSQFKLEKTLTIDDSETKPSHACEPFHDGIVSSQMVTSYDIVNIAALNAIAGLQRPGKENILFQVLGDYFENSPEFIQQIQDSQKAGQWAEMSVAAHSLRSTSAYVGAERLAEVCKQLEQLAGVKHTTLISTLCMQLSSEYNDVELVLSDYMNQQSKAA